jgi:hypothetical protein
MTAELPVKMKRVSPQEFWAHLSKWMFICHRSQVMPMSNSGGQYTQTGYFSVLEIIGTKMVPDESNLLAVARKAPTMSHGSYMGYFINLNARPDPL